MARCGRTGGCFVIEFHRRRQAGNSLLLRIRLVILQVQKITLGSATSFGETAPSVPFCGNRSVVQCVHVNG